MVKNISIAFVITALLVMIPAVQAGTVTRVFDTITIEALTNMNVTLVVEVVEGTENFYAIDEIMPSEWTLVDPGFLNDSQTDHLKKMNTSDASDTSYTYKVRSPAVPNTYVWSGIYQVAGMGSDVSILGSTQVTVSLCTDGEFRDCQVGGLPVDDTGECELGGMECVGGAWSGNCDSPAPVFATAELCDGLDNNCDGSSDEDWPELGTVCTVGLGECQASGNYVCRADHTDSECSATPGTPTAELCPYTPEDENCDGIDTEYKGDTWAAGSGYECDGCVDINDLSLIGIHFGETSASGNWEAGADLVSNNEIDIFDLVTIGANFGNGC